MKKRAKVGTENDKKRSASSCEIDKSQCPWEVEESERLYEDNFGNRFTAKDTSSALGEALLEAALAEVKGDGCATPSPKKESPPPSKLAYTGQAVEGKFKSEFNYTCEFCKCEP